MHFIDGDPYGHLVWGDGKHDMDAFVATLNAHGFDGMLARKLRTAVTTMTRGG